MLSEISSKLRGKYREFNFPCRRYMDKHKCIFIHIPKTAGTSIINAITQQPVSGRLHLPWYIYEKANPSKFARYFKFAFVRNPWDRTFSAYNYLMRGGNKSNDQIKTDQLRKYKDFDDFVINGLGTGMHRNIPLFLPQAQFIIGFDQQPAVDFIGRVENIEEDYGKIAEKLRSPKRLPEINISTSPITDQPYRTPRAIESIHDLYRQDVELFRYSFSSQAFSQ